MLDDYIGDGVYVAFDGYGIELRANSHENPTDKIYLEPAVYAGLTRFAQRCADLKRTKRTQENPQ